MKPLLRLAAGLAAGIALLACSPAAHHTAAAHTTRPDDASLRRQYLRTPMAFETNRGQTDAAVDYVARGPGYTVFLQPTGAVFSLGMSSAPRQVIRMNLHGSNPSAASTPAELEPGKSHYFLGRHPLPATADVAHFGKVRYAGVYPGVDLVYYGNQQQLEYDFVVAPGADPRRIAMDFSGVRRLQVNATGDLVLTTDHGDVVQHKPVVYQTIDGKRRPVDGGYRLLADNRVGFDLAAYDRSVALVLDPVIAYSSYFGGSGQDGISSITTDSAGNLYVTGNTTSLDFPIAKAAQSTNAGGARDVFVAKFDPNNDGLLYSTYLGGSGEEYPLAVAVDAGGNVYLAGWTTSTDFPTVAAFQSAHGTDGAQADGFVLKLKASGNALAFSTYFGGNGADEAYALSLDPNGSVWIAGATASTNLPMHSPLQSTNHGGRDAFVGKLSGTGGLLYSTYLGGSSDDLAYGLAVDNAGYPSVDGVTWSPDFPVVGARQPTLAGSSDAFVATLAADGSALNHSTYLGGSGADVAMDLTVDNQQNLYIVGYTQSTDFPVFNAAQPVSGGGKDGFIAKFAYDGSSAFGFATYVGGSAADELREVSLRGLQPQAVGYTYSANFPMAAPMQSVFNRGSTSSIGCAASPCADGVLVEYGSQGNLRISTYLGGTGDDFAWAIASYGLGNTFVAGDTTSSDLHTADAGQRTPQGNTDAFLMRIGVRGYASYVHDFDGDFAADVLWRNVRTGANTLWLGGSATGRAVASAGTAWKVGAMGDFDCDGHADIFWRNASTGANAIWLSGNAATPRAVAGVSNLAWQVAGALDISDNGCREDVIWHNTSTGANVIWLGADATHTRAMSTVSDVAWEIAGVGDFDGDYTVDDVLWHNRRTGANSVWVGASSTLTRPITTVTNLDWKIVGVGDFYNDTLSDIVWRNAVTGANVIWQSGDSAKQQPVTAITNLAWQVAAIGDYNGDGRSDILWRNRTTGADVIWRSASSTHPQAMAGVSNTDWSIVP